MLREGEGERKTREACRAHGVSEQTYHRWKPKYGALGISEGRRIKRLVVEKRRFKGFEREDDARRVMEVLGKRLGRCGLSLHPDKTRLVPFRSPPVRQRGGKGPATFDFLAFTLYWGYSRKGKWGMWCKTRSARLRLAIQSVYDWCRSLS